MAQAPISTREEGPSAEREGRQRLYGAKRSTSGQRILEADASRYILVSPAAKTNFQRAVEAYKQSQTILARDSIPEDNDIIQRANVGFSAVSAESRAESEPGEGNVDRILRTVSKAIDTAKELTPTDAGALLARTQVFVDQAKLSPAERQDVRIPALEDALAKSFSGIEPTGESPFTPPAKQRRSRRSSQTPQPRRLSTALDEAEEPQQSLFGRAVGGVASLASRAYYGAPAEETVETDSPIAGAQPSPAGSTASEGSVYNSPTGTASSSLYSGSPHLSSVVSGAAQPSPEQQEARRQRELTTVQQMLREVQSIKEGPRTTQQPQTGSLPSAGHPHSHAPQTQNIGPQQMASQAGNPPGPAPDLPQPAARAIVNPLRQIVQRQTRDLQTTLGDVRTDIADEIVDLRGAVEGISQQNDLTAAELQTLLTNLEGGPQGNPPPAPLTAQLFAQGRLRARQLLDPTEVQSYETALRNRRVSKEKSGMEQRAVSQRLAAQPVLTRYVQEPSEPAGARRYRQPRFAGPMY